MYPNSITPQNATTLAPHFHSEVQVRGSEETIVRTLTSPAHWELFKYITTTSGILLSDLEKNVIAACVKIKKLRKRQYFLQEGDVCKYIGFITKGSTRMFSINERGQESIVAFGLETSWITDQESFKSTECSCYHIEALEDTEMLIMNLPQMEYLAATVPAVSMMFSQYQLQQLIYNQKRINSVLSMTVQERYYDLLKSCPSYSQRFSQNMIACYLGVKPETLSRIRKNNL